MSEPHAAAGVILWAMVFLAVKHTVGDFFLQTPYQLLNKGRYGHPGGLLHAGLHMALTMPVFVLIPPASVAVAALILAAEFLAHYHIDWVKEQVVRRRGWTTHDVWFWRALGLDQLAHGLTYVAIVAALVR